MCAECHRLVALWTAGLPSSPGANRATVRLSHLFHATHSTYNYYEGFK
jgi:hypothetical protein